jgi:hypothetical protein
MPPNQWAGGTTRHSNRKGTWLKAVLGGDRRLRQRVERLLRIIGKNQEQT